MYEIVERIGSDGPETVIQTEASLEYVSAALGPVAGKRVSVADMAESIAIHGEARIGPWIVRRSTNTTETFSALNARLLTLIVMLETTEETESIPYIADKLREVYNDMTATVIQQATGLTKLDCDWANVRTAVMALHTGFGVVNMPMSEEQRDKIMGILIERTNEHDQAMVIHCQRDSHIGHIEIS